MPSLCAEKNRKTALPRPYLLTLALFISAYVIYLIVILYFFLFSPKGEEVVRGYDFPVNSVWPEIASSLESRTPSIFAPGNPDTFHEVRW